MTALGIVVAALLYLYRDTALEMVATWNRSDTFAHCWLVLPIALWLMWRRRTDLFATDPRPSSWLLLPMAVIALLWLIGRLAAASVLSQFAVVAIVVLSVPTVLGIRSAWTLAFPLGFLFFAVPAGEFLVPMMMQGTANVTVGALRLTGIPVYREGLNFVIPSGSWSVVEACSGVRYLIASVMVGTLFAYLNYRSLARRLAFIAVSIAVPIVANWMRAYMIVMLGHLSSNRIATGADHLVYGWVLFGAVIIVLYMAGARWAEAAPEPAPVAPRPAAWPIRRGIVTAVAGLAVAALPPAILLRIEAREDDASVRIAWPEALPGGWSRQADEPLPWDQGYENPRVAAHARFAQNGNVIGVYAAYYRQQGDTRKLVSTTNLVLKQDDRRWTALPGKNTRLGATEAPSVILQPAERGTAAQRQLQVWRLYWVDGRFVAGDVATKLLGAWARVTGYGDDSAVLLLYAEGPARAAMPAFAASALDGIGAVLEQARRQASATQ